MALSPSQLLGDAHILTSTEVRSGAPVILSNLMIRLNVRALHTQQSSHIHDHHVHQGTTQSPVD